MAITDSTQFGRVGKFRFWCQKVLPAVYDDSLSYYELLCKVMNWLEELTEEVNTQTDAITELQELVQQFLDHDFDPIIAEAVEEWFEENEPEITADIAQLQQDLQDLETGIIEHLKNQSFIHKNVIYVGDSYGRGTGAGEGGSPNNQGWCYYLDAYIQPVWSLNVSNSAAGFVRVGHTAPYTGMNFLQQVSYAHDNQMGDMNPDDIDMIIIGGGINDYNQTDRISTAYSTIRGIQTLFKNAQIYYFPLASGDLVMDADHYDALNEACYGCAEGGAQVFNNAMWWLYPMKTRTSYGDNLHPNSQGYHNIGTFMAASLCGTYLTSSLWDAQNDHLDGLTIANDATNINFNARAVADGAWFGGAIKRTGEGLLATLPTYCRPTATTQYIVYVYANSTHQGLARLSVGYDGLLRFFQQITGTYDSELEYTVFVPICYCPYGNIWG